MSMIFRHISANDLKKTHQRLLGEEKERVTKKIVEEKIVDQYRSDWRRELGNPNS